MRKFKFEFAYGEGNLAKVHKFEMPHIHEAINYQSKFLLDNGYKFENHVVMNVRDMAKALVDFTNDDEDIIPDVIKELSELPRDGALRNTLEYLLSDLNERGIL